MVSASWIVGFMRSCCWLIFKEKRETLGFHECSESQPPTRSEVKEKKCLLLLCLTPLDWVYILLWDWPAVSALPMAVTCPAWWHWAPSLRQDCCPSLACPPPSLPGRRNPLTLKTVRCQLTNKRDGSSLTSLCFVGSLVLFSPKLCFSLKI